MNEKTLIQEIIDGNQKAFFELVDQYRDKVLNTCYRFLLDREDAEDVSQDVFVEVYASISKFRGDAKLSTWIYRIAVSKCLDELKKRKRKKRISSIGRILRIDGLVDRFIDVRKADDEIIEKEGLAGLYELLNGLPVNQRIAFTMGRMEGYTNDEIASIMGVSRMAVDSLISRAKNKLEKKIKNQAGS